MVLSQAFQKKPRGLFVNVSEENKPDEVQAHKEERDALLASSKKSMSLIISRYL